MDFKSKTCCFTGHRNIPSSEYEQIAGRLKKEIIKLIEKGIIYFGAGGALGFDTLAAETVLSVKQDSPQIRLILVLPCLTQTSGWSEKDIAVYEEIKARCDKVVYTSKDYTRGCMFKRNCHLVDGSSVCLCYLTEQTGGTAYTVRYAYSRGLRIINIAE
jgi:uncharacterized phage-like protein YoqJ